MKRLIACWFLCLSSAANAQNLSHSTIASTGGKAAAGALYLEWSVGEVAVHTLDGPLAKLSQGFLQPNAAFPLPVTLVYFSGNASGLQNELLWATSEEVRHSHFEVQKSPDGIHFSVFQKISGSGDRHTRKTYRATDYSPYTHTYYRLKQVDSDGTYSFSTIIHIKQTVFQDFTLYPNPVTDKLYLSVGKNIQQVQITVFNKAGVPVLRQAADAGEPVSLVIDHLPAGTYVVTVAGSGITWSGRFLKL
jgi:hypothetical protein